MAVKVAINGFGRIGRLAFRQMFDAEGYEVVAINDLTTPKMLAHLLKYDTCQKGFAGVIGEGKHTVDYTEDSIVVDGKAIRIYAEKNAADCPWGELQVTSCWSAPASTPPRPRARLTLTLAPARLSFPLPPAMTCLPSFTT